MLCYNTLAKLSRIRGFFVPVIAGHKARSIIRITTLMARATSLRRELLARERESAAAASKNLALPRVLLTITMAAFLIFPALLRLTST